MKPHRLTNVLLLVLTGAAWAIVNDYHIGSLQLLYQNDLLSNSSSTSALLLATAGSYENASMRCSMLSEALLTKVPSDVQDQLNYLVYSGQLETGTQLFICHAYDVGEESVAEVDCGAQLPALCTQSAPPYNISQLGGPVSNDRRIIVQTGDYAITGFRDARSFRFIGIPFAQPPLGPLRFEPPLPYNGSTAISALKAGKACIQDPTPYGIKFLNQSSEDCLNINIWTPHLPGGATASLSEKPVLLYFYGGSYEEGWSDLPDYDGGNLVSRGGVIVVTVNYRVGALGFLTTNTTINGNQGILDSILALQWVQQHISAFGGDPLRVMIFGQSAGAQSVVAQQSSSAAKGLFSAGVSQSSLLGVPFSTRDLSSHFLTPALANATNCTTQTEADMIACLRALPAELFAKPNVVSTVVEAGAEAYKKFDGAIAGLGAAETFIPITAASGGPPGIIDDQFQYLLGNRSIPNRVPVMIGNMRDEGGLFLPLSPALAKPLPTSEREYVGVLESGSIGANNTVEAIIRTGLFPLNTTDPDGVRDALVEILSSFAWQCPWQQAFRLATDNQIFPRLYTYIFDKGVPQSSTSPPRC